MQSALNLPTPPPELISLSHSLGEEIVAWINQHGPMPFDQYMQRCLYTPGLGYYVNGLYKFGASGDFVTAPEQGSLFAQALAWQIDEVACALGSDWTLMELGAGSGMLAFDLLTFLTRPPKHYYILEPSAALRAVQYDTLQQHPLAERIHWINSPPTDSFDGVVLANEVIDALPVKRWRWGQQGAEELGVTLAIDQGVGRLQWTSLSPDARLMSAIRAVQNDLSEPWPLGYQSEVCVDLDAWLHTVTAPMAHGVGLFIDYGYNTQAYYHPERDQGTLVCHYRHRAHFDPFVWPGLTDISAFVDFGALERAGSQHDLQLAGFTTQAEFILASRVHEAVLAEPDEYLRLKKLSELKRLTLPGEMGEKFKVMALSRGKLPRLSGFFGSIEG